MSSAERVLPVLLALCLAASALFFLIPGADAAESDYDEDLGAFYGYELRLIYSGSGATSVTWDFGDGSETAEGLIVTHRYEETGVYIVTQTAANEKGSSVAKYRVEIMGYPQIIYDLSDYAGVEKQFQAWVGIDYVKYGKTGRDGASFRFYKDSVAEENLLYDTGAIVQQDEAQFDCDLSPDVTCYVTYHL